MISEVIEMMFKPTTPFWTGRAMDLLFDGIISFKQIHLSYPSIISFDIFISSGVEIDCTSKQFKVKSVCAIFGSGENAAVQPLPGKKVYFQFSLLGAVSLFLLFIN